MTFSVVVADELRRLVSEARPGLMVGAVNGCNDFAYFHLFDNEPGNHLTVTAFDGGWVAVTSGGAIARVMADDPSFLCSAVSEVTGMVDGWGVKRWA